MLCSIENFMYSMVRFGLEACSVMVCVSDPHCMELCRQADFPCYDFNYAEHHSDPSSTREVSAMEQIAVLKLLHIPKALRKQVGAGGVGGVRWCRWSE